MKKSGDLWLVIIGASIITVLFSHQVFGLNLAIAETILVIYFALNKKFFLKQRYLQITSLGLLLTGIFSVITFSTYTYFVNILLLYVFVGVLIFTEVKSLLSAFKLAAYNMFLSQDLFFAKLFGIKNVKKGRSKLFFSKIGIFAVPLLIIALFLAIYKKSNPVFNNLTIDIGRFVSENLSKFINELDLMVFLTFAVGLLVSNFLFLRVANQKIIDTDKAASDTLVRKRKPFKFKNGFMAIKNEYLSGVFLLFVLNAILLVLNIIDINWVWFNFVWEGQYLKQFVHDGTYLLILSILISIFIVLYYFRGNLSFYSKNKLLKYLSYVWLLQNGILSISVAIRNFYYIDYFSLAYKRIGIMFFLILAIYGLFTVLLKVHKRKSEFYLFRANFNALLIVLTISSLVNWNSYIARYNFAHANESFLHLDFMVELPDNCLPLLDKELTELQEIDKKQKEIFPFEQVFMSPETYYENIEARKVEFITKWEAKKLLSWNFAEYRAYKQLTENKNK